METNLEWLLAPSTAEEFAKCHWGRAPLRVRRDDSSYFSELLPEADLEFALHTAARIPGAVEILIEEDRPIKCRSHAHAVAEFRRGKSLRIDSVQRFSRNIFCLSQNLAQRISCPINVNMYLTPGSGKKALDRHYDTHDIFVLQIHRNKNWRLYDPQFPAPLEFLPLLQHESEREMKKFRLQTDFTGQKDSRLASEFTMQAGDCLYLPRGVWHEAESEPGRTSCHLAVGIQPTTYLDLLTLALSQAALSHSEFRRPLPLGFANDLRSGEIVREDLEPAPQRSSA